MIVGRANYSAETKAEELLSPEATAMSTINHNPGDRFSLLIHVDKKRGGRESRTRRNRKSVNKLVCNVLFFFLRSQHRSSLSHAVYLIQQRHVALLIEFRSIAGPKYDVIKRIWSRLMASCGFVSVDEKRFQCPASGAAP